MSEEQQPTATAATSTGAKGGATTAEAQRAKADYKKTKLGWIPEDWELVSLGSHLSLLTDYESNGSFADVKANVRVYDYREYAWYVRATDLENDASLENVRYVDKHTYEFLRKTTLHGNEVLVTKRGEIGKVYRYHSRGLPATLGPNLYLTRTRESLDNDYFFKYLTSAIGRRELIRINGSTTLGAVYKDDFKAIKIILPPLPEQRRIAAILSTWDRAIATVQQLLAAQQKRKRGLMQELLSGKRRFEGFEGEWRTVRLGEIAKISKGVQLNAEHLEDTGPYPAMNGGISPSGYTDEWNTEGQTITISEGGNSCGFVSFMTDRFWCGGHCYAVQSKAELVNQGFLFHALKGQEAAIMGLRVGSGLPNIQKGEVLNFRLGIPGLQEQGLIEELLSKHDALEHAIGAYLEYLNTQKRGLMQTLLTGAVRVL